MIQNDFIRGNILGGGLATPTGAVPYNFGAQVPAGIINPNPQQVIGQWPYAVGSQIPCTQIPYTQVPYTQIPYTQIAYNQAQYSQVPYAQIPYGQVLYGQLPYGQLPQNVVQSIPGQIGTLPVNMATAPCFSPVGTIPVNYVPVMPFAGQHPGYGVQTQVIGQPYTPYVTSSFNGAWGFGR